MNGAREEGVMEETQQIDCCSAGLRDVFFLGGEVLGRVVLR